MPILRFYSFRPFDHYCRWTCYYLTVNDDYPTNLCLDSLSKLIIDLLPSAEQITTQKSHEMGEFLEIGPRLNWTSPWGTLAKTILHRCGYPQIEAIERSRLFLREQENNCQVSRPEQLYDAMTEMIYEHPLDLLLTTSTSSHQNQEEPNQIPLDQLAEYNQTHQFGLDDFDIEFCQKIFQAEGRDPTTAELSDLAQCNSEHSRHWLFRGLLQISSSDENLPETLFDWIKKPLLTQQLKYPEIHNSLVAIKDNSSVIRSQGPIPVLQTSALEMTKQVKLYPFFKENRVCHPIFTAETHNFPTGIAPFPGATTGTGGRIRDIQATGRGGQMIAGTAGYCVGALDQPDWSYPLHRPAKILVEASNGASDYGNKIGEPIIQGFCRSFGAQVNQTSTQTKRLEWVKPIMFTGGVGQIWDEHVFKEPSELGWLILRLGGPTYRIGLGGGSASSQSQSNNQQHHQLFQQAVQRGDPEMENKVQKVLRTCWELGARNPIRSIHDQGAGGMANVTQEIVSEGEGCGGLVSLGNIQKGDPTLTARELWIAESQEQNTILIHPKDAQLLKEIGARENCPIEFFGVITNSGRIQVYDPTADLSAPLTQQWPVDLDLNNILADLPQKTFPVARPPTPRHTPVPSPARTPRHTPTPSPARTPSRASTPIMGNASQSNLSDFPPVLTPEEKLLVEHLDLMATDLPLIIQKVFQLPAVGSKRFLTNKVDRSVTGLIAQQQCVGPLQTPLSNVAVVAQSHYSFQGIATAIGEQPLKSLLDPYKMARLTTGELLTNLVWAPITKMADIKCSGNWMWEKRDPKEVWALYEAVRGLSSLLCELNMAIDGGKDSLSMSAQVGSERVLSPRTLVLSGYVGCPDIRKVITPDLKPNQEQPSVLCYLDLAQNYHRLGGSAFTQAFEVSSPQEGCRCPDVQDPQLLARAFEGIQYLISLGAILAGHDRSDGGLITTLLEMALSSANLGWDLTIPSSLVSRSSEVLPFLWAEELGLVIQIDENQEREVTEYLRGMSIPCYLLGSINHQGRVRLSWHDCQLLNETTNQIRLYWEQTSLKLEREQCLSVCVQAEQMYLERGVGLAQNQFWSAQLMALMNELQLKISPIEKVQIPIAILREEGSNGDREMTMAFERAGFSPYDVTMTDLLAGRVTLDFFQGLAFVGGFSFGDVLGAGRGWAQVIQTHPNLKEQFETFRQNPQTFSLGVCNGAQLMTELGWVPGRLVANQSGRFESRYLTVKITEPSKHSINQKAIMLQGFEGSCLGVWVAHAEGRWLLDWEHGLLDKEQIVLQYVDEDSRPTADYPQNPNGSPNGVAGLCSADGRHLAMMPHPERTVLNWQCPWLPEKHQAYCRKNVENPWQEMFRNAYRWCLAVRQVNESS